MFGDYEFEKKKLKGWFSRLHIMLIARGDSVYEEKNDYDYIVIQTSTNDVGNLSTDEILKDMKN